MNKLIYFFITCFILCSISIQAQDKLWSKPYFKKIDRAKDLSDNYDLYQLDLTKLKAKLKGAAKKGNIAPVEEVVVSFPNADRQLTLFSVKESQIMHPELAAKFPTIKSYIGTAKNSSDVIYFSINHYGLHAMIFSAGKSTVYIDPVDQSANTYMVYKRSDLQVEKSFSCLVEEVSGEKRTKSNFKNANDLTLRTFELALATTEEYSDFHTTGLPANASRTDSINAVMSAINVTLTRVNAIFEREVALTMQLVPNNDQLIFLSSDPGDDPYSNGNGSAMLNENQITIDNIIGSANYDIGHVFSTGGGGVAFLGSPCGGSKAGGVTGQSSPVGDPFDVDFVAHEMGHQFGANHTFNGTAGSCSGNRNNSTAVEPGSGSTIMAYAGICTPQNVQLNSDDYFNIVSIQEIYNFISSGSASCNDETSLPGNANAPTANAGSNFTVPNSTPLVLKGQGSDVDGDAITFCWEQIDNGVSGISSPPVATQTQGAVFRSLLPTTSPDRYLPSLSTVIAGDLMSTWQVLPTVGRTMDFSLTVRDNVAGGGQTASSTMTVLVADNAGPFQVTSHNAKEVYWVVGASETITWDVANTNIAPVNSPNVNILLSLDGGFTYPVTLANNVANDGSHVIIVPNNLTNNARIKVEGANHIFYALNKTDISIVNDFALTIDEEVVEVCSPANAVFDFNINFAAGFNETVTFSAIDVPAGATVTFNPTTANANTNVQMTVSGIANVAPDSYTMMIRGTSPSFTREVAVILTVFESTIKIPNLVVPTDGAIGVLASGTTFTWEADTNVETYSIEIAEDALFNTIIESATLLPVNSYSPQNLQDATTYYWRVQPSNPCVTGSYSTVSVFTTSEIVCRTYNAVNVPLNIPDNNPSGVTSTIVVPDDFIMSDVNTTINITHSWMRDLILSLESPQGTSIELVNRQCGGENGNQNMAATFDNLGVDLVCANASPVITGTIKPSEDIISFNGESSLGTWTLNISDNAAIDTGTLTSWSLELCESVAVANTGNEQFQNLAIWPNPFHTTLNISFLSTDINDTYIEVYDMIGRKVFQKKYVNNSILFNEQLEIDHIISGTYLIRIRKGSANTIKRLLKI